MDDESKAINKQNSWEPLNLQIGKNKWSKVGVCRGKKNANREIIRYKEMLVAKGYSQRYYIIMPRYVLSSYKNY